MASAAQKNGLPNLYNIHGNDAADSPGLKVINERSITLSGVQNWTTDRCLCENLGVNSNGV